MPWLRSEIESVAVATVLVLCLLGACSDSGAIRADDFYGAYEQRPGDLVLELAVCTNGDERANVLETAEAVTIADVTATVQVGDDCSGALSVELVEPLGDRPLVVDGVEFVPFDGSCDRRVTLVPPGAPDWFLNCG